MRVFESSMILIIAISTSFTIAGGLLVLNSKGIIFNFSSFSCVECYKGK